MKFLLALFTICLLISCESTQTENNCPQSYFIQEFPKRAINLQNFFGLEFGIKSNNYTTYYTIEFQSKTRINLIKEKNSNDTIFFGKASRYRGLLYFSHQLKDSTWHIQAVKVEGDRITGFNAMQFQMCLLDMVVGILNSDVATLVPDTVIIDTSATEKSSVTKPIVTENSDNKKAKETISVEQQNINKAILKITLDKEKPERLFPDKNSLKIIYSVILGDFKTDTIIDTYSSSKHETVYNIDQLTEEATVTDPESTIRLTLFPNPVINQLNAKFNKPGKYSCEIINSNGAIVLKTMLQKIENEINLADLKTGVYFLKVSDNELNNIVQKFIKQ